MSKRWFGKRKSSVGRLMERGKPSEK